MGKEVTGFTQLSDEQLCLLVAQGSLPAEDALVSRHAQLVRICARPLFLAGGDHEDLFQEGMLGLLAAVRTFDPAHQTRFDTYAEVCIRRRLTSAIRDAVRDKHIPLNSYISFETPLFDTAMGALSIQKETPEDVFIGKEEWKERFHALKDQLSGFEAKVLALYLSGLSYDEIARHIGKTTKSVDNAVQRIRRKVARLFNSGEISQG
ncbi:MAG: sigma-70 family RNA polymerase sigma factor [Oscillospiraceae bacterium]|nr:sigma-70 family RNA polymerase sigma factor [Oscillospiraceae bacterium]